MSKVLCICSNKENHLAIFNTNKINLFCIFQGGWKVIKDHWLIFIDNTCNPKAFFLKKPKFFRSFSNFHTPVKFDLFLHFLTSCAQSKFSLRLLWVIHYHYCPVSAWLDRVWDVLSLNSVGKSDCFLYQHVRSWQFKFHPPLLSRVINTVIESSHNIPAF